MKKKSYVDVAAACAQSLISFPEKNHKNKNFCACIDKSQQAATVEEAHFSGVQ